MVSDELRYERRHTKKVKKDGSDARTPAQKDRDRVLYTSALRRLTHITEVVAPDVGHVFHNRLTHSLQVAQVGRRLAEKLRTEFADLLPQSEGLDPDVVEAACLVHDLGHPPFGHIAEEELNDLAGERIGGFEGNAQSFRIVTRLSQHSPMHRGLDLTRATLAAVLKYPWQYEKRKKNKWGAFDSETKDFNFAMELALAPGTRTVEADVMDWSDDITYSVHDVEDFYRAGRIPLHLLAERRYDKERARFFAAARARHPEPEGIWRDKAALEDAFTDLITHFFPLEAAYSGAWQERASLRDFTSQLIGRLVGTTKLEVKNGRTVLSRDPNVELEVAMLKELTWVYVIEGPGLASQQDGQRRVIRRLFEFFEEAVAKKHWHLFTPYYRAELMESDQDGRRRVLIDLIAGMTEAQALAMYNRLLGVDVGFGLHDIL